MGTTTIGILAHVDAGKTSLTERILFETGVIKTAGRVDHGTTQTDTMDQERARGITIKAAVASFTLNDRPITLVDTPGHADFIAEVERSLTVLDGVVLVISAVEGIQPQTRKLARAIRAANLPLIVFINKIDRVGARDLSLIRDIRARLDLPVLPLNRPVDSGSSEASVTNDFGGASDWTRDRLDLLSENSDALIDYMLETNAEPPDDMIIRERDRQISDRTVVPAIFGSATLGIGIGSVLDAIATTIPEVPRDIDGPTGARVFKVQHTPSGERLVLARVISGTLKVRDRLGVAGSESEPERVTGLDRFEGGARVSIQSAQAGDIVCLHGIRSARIGDTLGDASHDAQPTVRIATPPLESIVAPIDPAKSQALNVALERLADGDPFISPRLNPRTGEVSIRLFGDVQTEVISEQLRSEFGVEVQFGETRPVCIERPIGTGSALEIIGTPENPFFGTVGFTVSSGEIGSGITYTWEPGSLPPAYYRVIEETTLAWLNEGLFGWEVTDIRINLDQVGYWSPVTTGTDFRKLTPLVLFAALDAAGTAVCEPINRYEVEGPADSLSEILRVLGGARLIPEETTHVGEVIRVSGTVPVAQMRSVEHRLLGLGGGEVSVSSEFLEYRPVTRRATNPVAHPTSIPATARNTSPPCRNGRASCSVDVAYSNVGPWHRTRTSTAGRYCPAGKQPGRARQCARPCSVKK